MLRIFILLSIMLFAPLSWAENVAISQFAQGSLKGWEKKSFSGTTQYQFVIDGGKKVLQATANASASGLGKKIQIDLNKTPILNWSWRVDNQLKGINERSKTGDDYSARVYVVIDGGLIPWNSKALSYVWSSNEAKNARWDNAFLPKNAKMVAVRGKSDAVGQWVTEKRNIKADLKALFGIDARRIDAIAIMSDTDNSGGKAKALYGELFFSAN